MLEPYPDTAARERALTSLAETGGGTVLDLGRSVQRREIRALRLPSTAPDAPRVLITAAIHGVEWVSTAVALEVARQLAEGHPLRDLAEVVVVPCVNVDGYAATEDNDGHGTLKQLRCNASGVDLNRNFEIPAVGNAGTLWQWLDPSRVTAAGSADCTRATWRGPAPLSEPEARAVAELARAQGFHAAVALHSFMGSFIPPAVRCTAHAQAYKHLVDSARAEQSHRYLRLAGWRVDVLTGELDDWLHHEQDCWAITMESFSWMQSLRQHLRAPSLFWRFNPRAPGPTVKQDAAATLAWLKAALALPRPSRLQG